VWMSVSVRLMCLDDLCTVRVHFIASRVYGVPLPDPISGVLGYSLGNESNGRISARCRIVAVL
jgi:hypothetical protein